MFDLVTVGESMVLFQPFEQKPLNHTPLYTQTIAGAESNVAIALTRLGKKVRWISRVGGDPFGRLIRSTLSGEGIDTSFVIEDNEAPSAVFFKEFKGYGDPNVYYYRKGSAASKLSAEDISPEWLIGVRHLHVTGITAALGERPREMVFRLVKLAKERGITVSLDPNIRRKLGDEQTAKETIISLLQYCDIFMPGMEEAEFLFDLSIPDKVANHILTLGPRVVVIKLGKEGSVGYTKWQSITSKGQEVPVVVDTVGAGDAYAAGFLSIILEQHEMIWTGNELNLDKETLTKALHVGNVMGSLAVQFKGDWEGLPYQKELYRLIAKEHQITR